MKNILFAFALAVASFAPGALANDDNKNNHALYNSPGSEFDADLSPAINVRSSQTGRLFALDLNPHINVHESTLPLFSADLAPAINLSSRTQGLFDVNPHINVR